MLSTYNRNNQQHTVSSTLPKKTTYSEREDEDDDYDENCDDEGDDEREEGGEYYQDDSPEEEYDSANHSAQFEDSSSRSTQSFSTNQILSTSPTAATSSAGSATVVPSSALPTIFQQQSEMAEYFVRKVRRRQPNYSEVTYNVRQTYDYIVSQTPMNVLQVMGANLSNFIDSLYDEHIDSIFMQNFFRRYYNSRNFQTPEERRLYFKLEVVMKSAVVYYLLQKNATASHTIKLYEPEEMVDVYPQIHIRNDDSNEIIYLTNFCNAMRIAVRMIPPKSKKQLLISICARLEGSGRSYLAGGVQNKHTKNRMHIFEQESGVQPMKRAKRRSIEEVRQQVHEESQKCENMSD